MAASSLKPPALLAVDPDPATQTALALAFSRPGAFLCQYIADPKKTAAGLRQLRPELLLVHAELDSLVMEDVFRCLASQPGLASLPVVLLCQEDRDRGLLRHFRSGVVHRLVEPFRPEVHVPEVVELLRSLPARTGMARGQGRPGELAALVEHLRRTRRSGALALEPSRPGEGSALFVNGALRSAQWGPLAGDAALEALAGAAVPWTFTELAGQAGDGAGIVIEVGAREEAGTGLEVEGRPAEEEAPPAAPIRVLLVDDDPELCRMFGLILRRRGMEVVTAPDGVEGYDRASQGAFDVVVADLSMPRMDGWGLLRQLREDHRTRELPVAFLSCHDDYRESLRALDAGAQAYLSKSVKHDELARQLRDLLAPRHQVQAGLEAGRPVALQLGRLGPQWLMRELGRRRATGRLEARDDWAAYRLELRDGEVASAHAQAGPHAAEGEAAFIALLGSRSAAGTFQRSGAAGPAAPAAHPLGPLEALLERAIQTLNGKEHRAREALLVKARRIQVDPALYALYTEVGPKPWLATAKLICEDRLPPAEVIARSEASPIEVEETLKDLLRRGVVTLEA